jgi:hypothetical protein
MLAVNELTIAEFLLGSGAAERLEKEMRASILTRSARFICVIRGPLECGEQ